jgi:anion-transporting  ArsA/GET3 family ATPase
LLKRFDDSQATVLHVVMLAEPMPDHETERLLGSLQELGLRPDSLFVNRVLFRKDVGQCRRCRRAMEWQRNTLAKITKRYKVSNIYVVRNFPYEIAGKKALQSFTGELWRLA